MSTQQAFLFPVEGAKLYAEQWLPAGGPPKAIVQIAHGMRESTGYYREFCEALAAAGYGCVVHDARGHGRTAGAPGSEEFREKAGDIGEDGIRRMVEDLAELTDSIRARFPSAAVFLLGHSMGSVLARLYAGRYGEKLDGLIYSGTTGPVEKSQNGLLLQTALREQAARGARAEAVETPALLFRDFNERFSPARTGSEYMSRDEEMVRAALASPFADVPYRCRFYVDFLRAMGEMDEPALVERIPKALPILSVSGDMDPFGSYGEGIRALAALYRAHGLRDTTFLLYPGGRHEMLRETNRKEVFADIVSWLGRRVPAAPPEESALKIAISGRTEDVPGPRR